MRRRGEKKEERKEKKENNFCPFFSFLPSFAVPLLRISQRMNSSTTAVPKKLRSVQKIKSKKQNREYWFPCGWRFEGKNHDNLIGILLRSKHASEVNVDPNQGYKIYES